jgi:hypothetical protein
MMNNCRSQVNHRFTWKATLALVLGCYDVMVSKIFPKPPLSAIGQRFLFQLFLVVQKVIFTGV